MQLKTEAKLLTVIGLTTKHVDCRVIYVIFNTFVTYYILSELIGKVSLIYIFYILSHHKIPVPIDLDAKVS